MSLELAQLAVLGFLGVNVSLILKELRLQRRETRFTQAEEKVEKTVAKSPFSFSPEYIVEPSLTLIRGDGSIIGHRHEKHPDVADVRAGKHPGIFIKEEN